MRRAAVPWLPIPLAAAAALVSPPASWVERLYSHGWFPAEQEVLTRLSNPVPWSLFDVIGVASLVVVVLALVRTFRAKRWGPGLAGLIARGARAAAMLYLVFLATWGLNYRRVPLQDKLAFEPGRVTPEAARRLAVQSIGALNRLYGAAHQDRLTLAELADAFHRAQAVLGDARPIVPGRPKPTLLGGYFHAAAIAGMTDPYLLETMLSPDLLEAERPYVILHEWAHLAGYADESEANYVAWVACQLGPPAAQYSAWFSLLGDLQGFLPKQGGPRLDIGPRIDVFAARYRYQGTSRAARAVARQGYDTYLRANHVASGIESYDLVLRLILGTQVDADGRPRLR